MDIERQRGISVSSSVLQFDYAGRRMNLLDTPGHNDFSEDTYRTLAAADTAIMLIDCVKGVEPQTIKLFQVCRMRGIPIVTFINKMDRVGKDPFDLMDEIERVLGVPCSPANWPLGQGTAFVGVYDRWAQRLVRFERLDGGGARRVPMARDRLGRRDAGTRPWARPTLARTRDEVELLESAGNPFDAERFQAGQVTPVFFGSAMNNFGLEPFLDQFVDLAQPPRTRTTSIGPLRGRRPDLLGLRVQDPGEHGSPAPRPHRLHAHLLGPVQPGHGRAARAHRQDAVAHPAGAVHGPGAHPGRRGVLGRHPRRVGSGRPAHRRQPVPRARRSSSRASPASRPNTSCACAWTIR